jgi:TonB family protein
MGVDFDPYLQRILPIVRTNWYNLMPPSAYPPIKKQGEVVIEFSILRDGKVSEESIRTSSGDVALDRAAWNSIVASDPSPPLPKEFPGLLLGLRFYYFYNLTPGPDFSISPCIDVQVPAGSRLQFFTFVKAVTDTSMAWSVSGPGCSQSACGTISDTGLYTAPADIPSPPTVIVEATLSTNPPTLILKSTARVKVSITAKPKVTNEQ